MEAVLYASDVVVSLFVILLLIDVGYISIVFLSPLLLLLHFPEWDDGSSSGGLSGSPGGGKCAAAGRGSGESAGCGELNPDLLVLA